MRCIIKIRKLRSTLLRFVNDVFDSADGVHETRVDITSSIRAGRCFGRVAQLLRMAEMMSTFLQGC